MQQTICRRIAAITALVIFASLLAACSVNPQPAANPQPPATAQVARTTLVETRSVSGTLGYGELALVKAGGEGMLTWIAPVGSTVAQGEPLFKVNEQPVVALYGSVPLYRTLSEGVEGADVLQLEENLAELGYTGYTRVNINVLSNDRGAGLSVSAVTSPANGTAVVNDDNTISYTPHSGFEGIDIFHYTVTDSGDLSDTAHVTVVVIPVSPPQPARGPAARPDVATTTQDRRVTVEVTDNDLGEDLQVSTVGNPANGTAVVNGNNTITYTPASGFRGVDTFSYTITDASGLSASALVTVVVSPSPPPPPARGPAAHPDVATAMQDTPDAVFTPATTEAVRDWQVDTSLPASGMVEPGQVVFLPGAIQVAEHAARIGEMVGSTPVIHYTGLDRLVSMQLRVADLALAVEGEQVSIALPDGRSVVGVIASIGAVVRDGTVEVTVTIADQEALGSLQGAPVEVSLVSQERADVLAVPVSALLALAEGGYGVEVIDGSTSRIVAVRTGMFAAGRVEISGEGIAEGVTVGVAR